MTQDERKAPRTTPSTSTIAGPTEAPEPAIPGQAQPLEPLKVTLHRRLHAEGRWTQVEPLRDLMMREARAKGMTKEQAQEWTYAELDRMYPPLQAPVIIDLSAQDDECDGVSINPSEGNEQAAAARPREGLGGIPADWPELPDNAPLAVELGWVQSQRLRIVEERPNGSTVVRLERAGSPPPSWAALGWLETSIRSYAKFVDICAKGLGQAELESDLVKRERRSIEDVRRLLAEMIDNK